MENAFFNFGIPRKGTAHKLLNDCPGNAHNSFVQSNLGSIDKSNSKHGK